MMLITMSTSIKHAQSDLKDARPITTEYVPLVLTDTISGTTSADPSEKDVLLILRINVLHVSVDTD